MTAFFLLSSFAIIVAVLLIGASLPTAEAQCGQSRRRSWRSLSCQEQRQFLDAVQELKDRGIYDEFVRVHWESRDFAHNVPELLPWHRWFVWVFEQELQRVTGSCISVPYWDWERGDTLPIMFKASTFGTRNRGCATDGIAADWDPAEGGERCLQREFDNSVSFTRDVELLSRITNFQSFDRFSEAMEGSPHAGPHSYVGGAMDSHWSPDDPIFWLHHSNFDRIWALWQDYYDHDEVADENIFGDEHYHEERMDQPLRIIGGSNRVNFNNPRQGRPPTVREVLINADGPLLNVQYVNDSLGRLLLETSSSYRNGGNNPNWISPSNGQVIEQCQGDDPGGNNNNNNNNQDEEEEEEPTCLGNGDSCQSSGACCSGFCNWNDRCDDEEEEPTCLGNGDSCQSSGACCSGFCNWNDRCDDEEEEPSCLGNGDSCQSSGACCSGFCNWNDRCDEEEEEPSCLGNGDSCQSSGACCSGFCNWNGRCDDEEVVDESDCVEIANQCSSGDDCCSGYCNSRTRTCGRVCFGRGSRCESDDDCCWGGCNPSNGRCNGTSRRHMRGIDVETKDEPLEFSSPEIRSGWYELIAKYPDDPARIWDILAAEDCANRAAIAGHEIQSASEKWINTIFKGNDTHVFDCHFRPEH